MTTSELKSQRTSKRTLLDSGPFTSYSLNFEDVILHRLFPGTENGFYVDVGAGHPRFENDTFSLYRRGWRGINIEPNQGFHAALMEERPRDTNIRTVLSDSFGDVCTYHELDGSGLSTCNAEQAAAYQAIGLDVVKRKFPAKTLSSILSAAGVMDINILKVDVEGFEEKVLAGNDWERFRPDVVLIEATYPENPIRRPTNIPIFLKERGYRHVHFDGLNDFYLEGGFEAPPGLSLPPNVFDRFVPHQIAELRVQVDSLSKHLKAAEEYALSLETEVKSLRNQAGANKEVAGTLQNEVELLRSRACADKEHASYLQCEIQLLGVKLVTAEEHATEKQKEYDFLKGKLSVAENEALTLRSEGEEAHQEEMQANFTAAEESVSSLQTRAELLRTNSTSAEEYALSLETEVESLRIKSASAEEYALSLETEVESLRTKSATAAEYALSLETEVESLRTKSATAAEYALSLETEVKLLRTKCTTIEEYALSLESEVESLRTKSATAAEYALSLETEVESVRTKCTTIEEYDLSLERTAEALAAENRRLGHEMAHLTSENRRLRKGAEQMRSELLLFNKLLEPFQAKAEQRDPQRRDHNEEPDCSNNPLVAAKARLASVYSSRCWRLTAPLRWCDDIQRRLVRRLGKRLD
jgi:FkbM family methyltransferase